jgi:hypothetical protein
MRCASHTTVRTGLVYSGSLSISCSRSLHQLHSASFKIRLAMPPYRIGNDLTFSPSMLCETSVLSNGSFPATNMTSADFSFRFRQNKETSPGKINSLRCIAAASTYNCLKICSDFVMMCSLIHSCMPHMCKRTYNPVSLKLEDSCFDRLVFQ